MRGHHAISSGGLLALLASTAFGGPATAPFPDAFSKPPPGWTGPIFKLSQNYPTTVPPDTYPWKSINFKTQPEAYIRAVLEYAYDGNIDTAVDWAVQKNTKRNWYHVPWMHSHAAGREFIHGMTQERPSGSGDLHPSQTRQVQNWAVSVYNAPGGFTIGRVWQNHTHPNPSLALFPDNTVAVKLLFTGATPTDVPFLKNAHIWQADTNRITSSTQPVAFLSLLQIDVAVRDSRANSTTGWVFGTFIYNGDAPGATSWDRTVPVGLMWGNDPGVTNPALIKQTWLNPAAKPLMQHFGYADRLNGPVDNPKSSCLSCHASAQVPQPRQLAPTGTAGSTAWMNWFRNIKAGQPFRPGLVPTDYSLQLSMGIRFFQDATGGGGPSPVMAGPAVAQPGPAARRRARSSATKFIPRAGEVLSPGSTAPRRTQPRGRNRRRAGLPPPAASGLLGAAGLLWFQSRRRARGR